MRLNNFPACCGAAVLSDLPDADREWRYVISKKGIKRVAVPSEKRRSVYDKISTFIARKRAHLSGSWGADLDNRVYYAITAAYQPKQAQALAECGFKREQHYKSPTTGEMLTLWAQMPPPSRGA